MPNLILLLATTPPSDSPTIRPGLDPDQVSPGFLGFLFTFGVVVIMFFLIRDMVKRIRRVRYRAQVEEDALAAEGDGGQGDKDPGAGGLLRADDGGGRPGRPASGQNYAGGKHGPDGDFLGSGKQDDGPADGPHERS
ncbi:hypothetical protein [Paenarthrobacter sp. PH39-S1]|uniref:hypothetical protein n=1 Tax=Paenarthrobacter sp. PH39-S1 TaxID=3046204 RepID=UPI0024BA2EEC|nr:hypothetical protein [Paenarthrobacter sp. PH39-S1]MDJ0354748.1 hypothetical protein [Paenarthrobacter sp. PH39-S1]